MHVPALCDLSPYKSTHNTSFISPALSPAFTPPDDSDASVNGIGASAEDRESKPATQVYQWSHVREGPDATANWIVAQQQRLANQQVPPPTTISPCSCGPFRLALCHFTIIVCVALCVPSLSFLTLAYLRCCSRWQRLATARLEWKQQQELEALQRQLLAQRQMINNSINADTANTLHLPEKAATRPHLVPKREHVDKMSALVLAREEDTHGVAGFDGSAVRLSLPTCYRLLSAAFSFRSLACLAGLNLASPPHAHRTWNSSVTSSRQRIWTHSQQKPQPRESMGWAGRRRNSFR